MPLHTEAPEMATLRTIFDFFAAQRAVTARDYFVFDVETTGPVVGEDLITQVGHCIVRNGVAVHRSARVLNWADCSLIPQDWLRQRMEKTKQAMEERGREYHTTYESLRQGDDPLQVLSDYLDLFEHARFTKTPFVGHNAWQFDRKIYQFHFDRFLQESFEWDENEILDTGMIEKAVQLNSVPRSGDSLRDWSLRVASVRARGVFWSLDAHAVPKYGLAEKYGLDMQSAHDAGFDCYLTHLLRETYRNLFEEVTRGEETPPFQY